MKAYFDLRYHFSQKAEELWPFISDTERINRLTGYSSVKYEEFPLSEGGSSRFGNGTTGFLGHRYREFDFEWEAPHFTSVELHFTHGPLKSLYRKISLTETETGTELLWNVEVGLRNIFELISNWIFFRMINFPKLVKVFREIESAPQKNRTFSFQSVQSDNKANFEMPAGLSANLEKVFTKLNEMPKYELTHLRPYRIAKALSLSPKDGLRSFVEGTKDGFFDLQWNLICPSCRSPKASYSKLSDLVTKVHCPACNIDINADFDQSLELTFRPNARLMNVDDSDYCVGNPMRTPHVYLQRRLKEGEELDLSLNLPKNRLFRLFSLQVPHFLEIANGHSYTIVSRGQSWQVNKDEAQGETKLKIKNENPFEITFKIEAAEWLEDIVTAREVSNLQEFRDFFATEALRPGTELSVKNITLLFTDLKGSTAFYNRVGDGLAFGKVRDHFDILIAIVSECDGAVVKTIGDAVMASFLSPLDGLKAAILMQKRIQSMNNSGQEKISIKIGLHSGPALVVNLNGRLDYFGATVNLAARTEGQCHGDDIVFTKEILTAPGIVDFVKSSELKLTRFKKEIKGFENDGEGIELFRIS